MSYVFNTPLANVKTDQSLDEYFQSCRKIGEYCLLRLNGSKKVEAQIVIDSNSVWIRQLVKNYFNQRQLKLSLKEIQSFIRSCFEVGGLYSVKGFPLPRVKKSDLDGVVYFDQLGIGESNRNLVLTIVGQLLIEKYTKRDSRIVQLETSRGITYSILVRSNRGEGYLLMDCGGQLGLPVNHIQWSFYQRYASQSGKKDYLKIVMGGVESLPSPTRWDKEKRELSLIGANGSHLKFQVNGRSETNRRFKYRQELFERAGANEDVELEVFFHPFWRVLGHTSLRVGNTLYEMSAKGWRSHGCGADNPCSYLFNNPYFKSQFESCSEAGMPPISMSVCFPVKKYQANGLIFILESRVAAQGENRENFSLLNNNCNQSIMRVLKLAKIDGFSPSGYLGFSSVLSFRRLLLHPPTKISSLHIYPLPRSDFNPEKIRQWIPDLIYKNHSTAKEIGRAVPSMVADFIYCSLKKINGVSEKYLNRAVIDVSEAYFL